MGYPYSKKVFGVLLAIAATMMMVPRLSEARDSYQVFTEPFSPIRLPSYFQPRAVNDLGVYVGFCTVSGASSTCLYDSNTSQTTNIPAFSGGIFTPNAINNHGLISGDVSGRAAFATQSGVTLLTNGLPPSPALHSTTKANESDVLIGHTFSVGSGLIPQGGFFFHPALTAVIPLQQVVSMAFGPTGVLLKDINNATHVVGTWTSGSVTQSFAAAPLVGSNLITLDQTGYTSASALEINDSDQVVGSANNGSLSSIRPVTWTLAAGNRIRTLPLPAGFQTGMATHVNNRGLIVGFGYQGSFLSGPAKALVWKNGQAFDLNQLIPGLGSCDLRTIIDLNHENIVVVSGQDLSTLPTITQCIVAGKLN